MAEAGGIGIDAGSTTCKAVAAAADGTMAAWRIEPAHPLIEEQAARMVDELRSETGRGETWPVVATGYGRKLIRGATKNITEITCHAGGIFRELGWQGTLVDIGGQDTKVIVIGPNGRAVDFMMNDKCAAGTGRFLEHAAVRLDVSIDEIGARALATDGEESISSTCTVFAESEIISLVAHGATVDAILRGLHRSLVSRVVAMIRSVGLRPPLMLSGGVARNAAVRALLEEATGETVNLPEHPQLMGAYGAALAGLLTN
jgi:predicted CoA-substrate-specific enzyme activase